ncbi:MAG: DMT family transporter [Lentisphaerae bacterium]|nr:DMT family transporter [Lentisphaerota bacterium]MCP4102088.1 DMT family transporter [Lentisphaerota bacterium]
MKKSVTGWSAAILIGLLWGIPWVVGTPILKVVDAQMLVWVQYTIAFITLGIIYNVGLATGRLKKKADFKLTWSNRSDIFWTASCGIIGQAAFSYLSYFSLKYISASENGVIQGLIPILILTVGFLCYNARFTVLQILAAIGAFMGVAILITDNKAGSGGLNIGTLLCFASAASFASLAYARAKLAEKYGSVATMFHQFIFASIGLGLILLFSGADFTTITNIFTSPLRIICICILAIGISGLSYLLYIYAMETVGVDGTGMALNLMPLSSFILAVIALGEHVTAMRLIGVATVIFSMMIFMKFKYKGSNKSSEIKAMNLSMNNGN